MTRIRAVACVCLLLALGAVGLGACAHGPATPEGPTASHPLEAYMPLAVGTRWVYGTTFQGQPQPDLEVVLVREEGGFFLDNRPTPSRFRFDAEGLRDGATRYLLKAPLTQGLKWMSVADLKTVEHYEITAVERKVSVPAGVFDGCVTVRMEVRLDERRAMRNDMTFAPGVGMVDVRVSLLDGAKELPQSRLVLKVFEQKK
ncbi:MAG TPA: hypothetical protein PK668_22340 [Myxococcota bacterium]|nr:hypothetical protein [Myxococcota bacterium]HRY96285.1 hypothetical protein [Myxococcota bacterium]